MSTSISGVVQDLKVIVSTNTSVRVSWNNTRTEDITEYLINYKLSQPNQLYMAMSRTLPAMESSCVLSGLLTGKVYVFDIKARAVLGQLSISGESVSSEPVIIIATPAVSSSECTVQGNQMLYIIMMILYEPVCYLVTTVLAMAVVIGVLATICVLIIIASIVCFRKKRRKGNK